MNGKIILLTKNQIIFGLVISEASAMSDAETTANNILNTDNGDSDTLIVYFSRTGENYNVGNVEVGNTAMLASYIKEYLKCDSFEIVPMDKYPENYDECTELASKEKEDNARPKIDGKIDNFDSYKTVFIGYPIWWGDLPMIMYTFLEEYDLDGKTVIPFNTHEGSGNAGTYDTIKEKLPSANVNTQGQAQAGKTARSEDGKQQTIDWLKQLGY